MWIFPMGNTQTSIALFVWGNSNGNSNQRKDRDMEDEKLIKEQCEKCANDLAIAFEELAKSIAETGKAFNSLTDSVMKQSIADAFIEEIKWLDKLESSHWLTRWYYRMKYRKAKYARIQAERYYNQNFK